MRISIQEHIEKEINIKVNEGINAVQPIMPTSKDERESFIILKNTKYKIGVSKYCND